MNKKEEAENLGCGTSQYWEAITGEKAILPSTSKEPLHRITDKTWRYTYCFHCCRWILVEYWYKHFEGDCIG